MSFEPEPSVVALVDAIRRGGADEAIAEDLAGFFRARGVSDEDIAVLAEAGASRVLVYRSLVHNRLRNAIRDFVPRTIARLGNDRFRADFARFIDERAAVSYYLRDVPEEFVAWIAPQWRSDPDVPAYLPDLATHELLQLTVRNAPGGGEPATGNPVALDRPLRFDGSVRLMTYAHAVHKLSSDKDDRTPPPAEPTHLLVYRDEAHKVRYLELTAFAAAALRHLIDDAQPVATALQAAAADLGAPLDDERLGAAALLLADLAERKVMLGAT